MDVNPSCLFNSYRAGIVTENLPKQKNLLHIKSTIWTKIAQYPYFSGD